MVGSRLGVCSNDTCPHRATGWANGLANVWRHCGKLNSPASCVSQDLEEDDAASSVAGSVSKKYAYGELTKLPVADEGKPCTCSLCGELSTSLSPFHDAHDDDAYGGLRPWKRYISSVSVPDHKCPFASICLICFRVFRILGLHLKFKTVPKYLGSVKGNPEGHRPFLKSTKAYVNQVNSDPNGCKVLLNKAVIEARTTIDEEERQGTRAISRRTFVLEAVFKDRYEKDFAKEDMPAKDNHFVNQTIGIHAGFWLPGDVNTHLPGHFLYEDYADVSVNFRRRHEDGSVKLSKDQYIDKFKSIAALQNVDRVRAEGKIANLSATALLKTCANLIPGSSVLLFFGSHSVSLGVF
jgi:hypothetical protein